MRRVLCCSVYAVYASGCDGGAEHLGPLWWDRDRTDSSVVSPGNGPAAWSPVSDGWTLSWRCSWHGPKPGQALHLKQDGPWAEPCWGLPNPCSQACRPVWESAARRCPQWSRNKLWRAAASTGWSQDGCSDISVFLEFLFLLHSSATVT